MPGFFRRCALLPLWLRASAVILLGILLAVWVAGEIARQGEEETRLEDMRAGVERSVGLLAGLVSEAVVTEDAVKADAIIKQYVSSWPQVTFVHIANAEGHGFTEWQQKPVKFGDGILKFEQPVRFGSQVFGSLSLYVDLNDTLDSIHDNVARAQRREALTLLALALLIIAIVNYTAMQPVRALADRATGLLLQQGAIKAAEEAEETARIAAALALLERLMSERAPRGQDEGGS